MTEKDIYFHWSRGFPLSSAYHQIATKEQKTKYEELSKATSVPSISSRFQAYAEEAKENPPEEFWKGIGASNVLGPTSELSSLVDQLKAQIRAGIRAGKLRVFGFAKPRLPTDKPIEVPTDLWGSFISWDKAYIDGNGLRIEALRVIPAHWLQEESKRQGRPSRVDEIRKAYNHLRQSGQIDFSNTALLIAQNVQSHILSMCNDNDTTGLGLRAIQRAISRDINAERLKMSNE